MTSDTINDEDIHPDEDGVAWLGEFISNTMPDGPVKDMLVGFGMVVGNLVSGRLSDKYTPGPKVEMKKEKSYDFRYQILGKESK